MPHNMPFVRVYWMTNDVSVAVCVYVWDIYIYIIYRSGRDFSNFKKYVLVLVAFLREVTQACKQMQVIT